MIHSNTQICILNTQVWNCQIQKYKILKELRLDNMWIITGQNKYEFQPKNMKSSNTWYEFQTHKYETLKTQRYKNSQRAVAQQRVENRGSHKYEFHFHPWISNRPFSTRISILYEYHTFHILAIKTMSVQCSYSACLKIFPALIQSS